MIPKIIHYCWFGRKDKPKEVEENIANWRKMNPDFVIKEWNEDNFDFRALAFTKEAYAVGKYAFVSDVLSNNDKEISEKWFLEALDRANIEIDKMDLKQKKYNAQNEMDANMKINDAQKWLEKRRKIEYEERM